MCLRSIGAPDHAQYAGRRAWCDIFHWRLAALTWYGVHVADVRNAREVVRHPGALASVVSAMQRFDSNWLVQYAGCNVLGNVTEHGEIPPQLPEVGLLLTVACLGPRQMLKAVGLSWNCEELVKPWPLPSTSGTMIV